MARRRSSEVVGRTSSPSSGMSGGMRDLSVLGMPSKDLRSLSMESDCLGGRVLEEGVEVREEGGRKLWGCVWDRYALFSVTDVPGANFILWWGLM